MRLVPLLQVGASSSEVHGAVPVAALKQFPLRYVVACSRNTHAHISRTDSQTKQSQTDHSCDSPSATVPLGLPLVLGAPSTDECQYHSLSLYNMSQLGSSDRVRVCLTSLSKHLKVFCSEVVQKAAETLERALKR